MMNPFSVDKKQNPSFRAKYNFTRKQPILQGKNRKEAMKAHMLRLLFSGRQASLCSSGLHPAERKEENGLKFEESNSDCYNPVTKKNSPSIAKSGEILEIKGG